MSPATGPRTAEGKARSSHNALKHGLTAGAIILSAEEQQAYQDHCQSYVDLYAPVGQPEQVLVQSIADDYWRAQQGRTIQSARLRAEIHGSNMRNSPRAMLENEKALANLALYVHRIERSIKTNTQALEALQDKRKAAQRQAEEEVKLLARAAFARGETYNPANDFPPSGEFVFSTAQVEDWVAREDRLKQAAEWREPSHKVLKAA